MALTTFTAEAGAGIFEVALGWTGLASDKSLTIYRTESAVSNPSTATDWDSLEAVLVGTGLTGSGVTDYVGEAGTYYYYAYDGTEPVEEGGTVEYDEATVTLSGSYATEIQPDYEPTQIDKVSQSDAFRNALNNGGRVPFNPIVVQEGRIAIVAITGGASTVAEKNIGATLNNLPGITGFAILQTGTIQNFGGYNAQLSGATQIKYVKE